MSNSHFYHKYLKYKNKYLELRSNIQQGGNYNCILSGENSGLCQEDNLGSFKDEKECLDYCQTMKGHLLDKKIKLFLLNKKIKNSINIIKEVIKDNIDYIRVLLELKYEVGGDINLKTNEFNITKKGSEEIPTIESSQQFDINWDLVSFHTHVRNMNKKAIPSSTENYDEIINSNLFFIPSQIDLRTSLGAALFYNNPVVNIVISDQGIFIYWVQKEFIEYLNDIKKERGEEELENAITNYIMHNIGYSTYIFFVKHKNIKLFQEDLQKIILSKDNDLIGYGWDSIFIKYEDFIKN